MKQCRKCNREIHPNNNFCWNCVDSAPELELSNLENWLRHLDTCKLQEKGKCPNECRDGQYLVSRTFDLRELGH